MHFLPSHIWVQPVEFKSTLRVFQSDCEISLVSHRRRCSMASLQAGRVLVASLLWPVAMEDSMTTTATTMATPTPSTPWPLVLTLLSAHLWGSEESCPEHAWSRYHPKSKERKMHFLILFRNISADVSNANEVMWAWWCVIAGAVDENGRKPFYAEECASMLAVTFSSGSRQLRSIVSTSSLCERKYLVKEALFSLMWRFDC